MTKLKALTGGRVWAARLLVLMPVVLVVGLILAVLPAQAGAGPISGIGVIPDEVSLGGESQDCSAQSGVGSDADYEFRIVNPQTGSYVDNQSSGPVTFNLIVDADDKFVDYTVTGGTVFDLVIKGGKNSTHFDYITPLLGSTYLGGATATDTLVHAPTRGGSGKLYNVSHMTFCYSTFGSIAGTKFHDNDTDGLQDPSFETGESGWEISLFDSNGLVASQATVADGSYLFEDVPLGIKYTVCEEKRTSVAGESAEFSWGQSELPTATYSDWSDAVCEGLTAGQTVQANGGHQFTLSGDATGVDFANHVQVTLACDGSSATLGDSVNTPQATVTCPGSDQSKTINSSFDVGFSDDAGQTGEDFKQFVVFGGDPTATNVLTQTIIWAPETAVYINGVLQVPTTQVILDVGGGLADVILCSSVTQGPPTTTPGDPTADQPDCLDSRIIAEGGTLPAGTIQLTENYKFLGDPPRFR